MFSKVNCKLHRIGSAYAGNSINTDIFRKNAISTWRDQDGSLYAVCCYYNPIGRIIIAVSDTTFTWKHINTRFRGDLRDAHNCVCCIIDGDGFVHLALARHDGQLRYAVSDIPCPALFIDPSTADFSLHEGIIGQNEDRVTYPEFYLQPSGDLLFLYRHGTSADGDLVIDRYLVREKRWERVQNNLITGEGRLSPYWQACTDSVGRLHISWTWRRTKDVNSNFNICYAVSEDASCRSFVNSVGNSYELPIRETTAEVICQIPENSMLINQTSMMTDEDDLPCIASYWRTEGIVQYHIVRKTTANNWNVLSTGIRKTDFTLDGKGTKQLPCARPAILVSGRGEGMEIHLLLRDEETNDSPVLARIYPNGTCILRPLSDTDMGEWEPLYSTELWREERALLLFLLASDYKEDKKHTILRKCAPAYSLLLTHDVMHTLFIGPEGESK